MSNCCCDYELSEFCMKTIHLLAYMQHMVFKIAAVGDLYEAYDSSWANDWTKVQLLWDKITYLTNGIKETMVSVNLNVKKNVLKDEYEEEMIDDMDESTVKEMRYPPVKEEIRVVRQLDRKKIA
ncbi:hypothetical protein L6452_11455 [Arctium lappa]|uniref:Uncharacterized protein n=1 Tax=Arctium lappa TaxID=4217 RepID=A0ACB9DPC2_ARCLA|nr:hypothetical protein L6452_11455 [Arctium lappa]